MLPIADDFRVTAVDDDARKVGRFRDRLAGSRASFRGFQFCFECGDLRFVLAVDRFFGGFEREGCSIHAETLACVSVFAFRRMPAIA